MEKYVIISFIYDGEIVSDYHDISLDEFEPVCKKAVKQAKQKGVRLFFKEVYNERIIGDSFALVEHNFDLSSQEKADIVDFIASFFYDFANYTKYGCDYVNLLKAVRFLKTDGEMIIIKRKRK